MELAGRLLWVLLRKVGYVMGDLLCMPGAENCPYGISKSLILKLYNLITNPWILQFYH